MTLPGESAHADLRQRLACEPGDVLLPRAEADALLVEFDEYERRRSEGGPITGRRIPERRGTWENLTPPPLDVRPDGSTERTT